MELEETYTYDDLLLKPQISDVQSRDDVSLETKITPSVEVNSPLISAPMDSVTGPKLAQAMANNGGVGILHRFADWEERVDWVEEVDGTVGASVGVEEDLEVAVNLENAGADFICVDVAHGGLTKCSNYVNKINKITNVEVMAGNVATYETAREVAISGASAVKVGIGPGATCTTRKKTGHGVPQASALMDVSRIFNIKYILQKNVTIIADGGIREPGDAVKALMLGADSVMMGSIFGKCESSPAGGDVWGMASDNGNVDEYIEGEVIEGEEEHTVQQVFEEFEDGIRSGLSYSGGHTIEEARNNCEFIRVMESSKERNGAFL